VDGIGRTSCVGGTEGRGRGRGGLDGGFWARSTTGQRATRLRSGDDASCTLVRDTRHLEQQTESMLTHLDNQPGRRRKGVLVRYSGREGAKSGVCGRGRASVKFVDLVWCAGRSVLLGNGRWSSAVSGATRRTSRCQHAPPGLCTPRFSTRSGGEHGRGAASMLPARAVERQAGRTGARRLVRMNNVPTRKEKRRALSKSRVHVAARRTTTSRESRGEKSEW
jgi:hypothetical protein